MGVHAKDRGPRNLWIGSVGRLGPNGELHEDAVGPQRWSAVR